MHLLPVVNSYGHCEVFYRLPFSALNRCVIPYRRMLWPNVDLFNDLSKVFTHCRTPLETEIAVPLLRGHQFFWSLSKTM